MLRKLQNFEIELLKKGNCFMFAGLIIELYPDLARENNFDIKAKMNSYRAFTDFEDGYFTFYAKNGDKYFFDNNMRCIGVKVY